MKCFRLAAVVSLGTTLTATASAQLPPPAALDTGAEPRWYGWQTLLADAIPYTMFLASNPFAKPTDEDDAYVKLGIFVASQLVYSTVPPLVHLSHRKWAKAPGAVGLRAGLSITGVLTGVATGGCHDDNEDADARDGCVGAMKVYVGFLAAGTIIDAAALGWDASPRKPEPRGASIPIPVLVVGKNGGTVQLAGRF